MVFRTLVVIDICPCCCKCSIGRVGPAVVIQWLRGILTLIFQCLNLGTLDAVVVALAEVASWFEC